MVGVGLREFVDLRFRNLEERVWVQILTRVVLTMGNKDKSAVSWST